MVDGVRRRRVYIFFCQLIRNKTWQALEKMTNECVNPSTHVSADEHKLHHWLGKTTNDREYQPSLPALHVHYTIFHEREFKASDGTHANVVEGQNLLSSDHMKL